MSHFVKHTSCPKCGSSDANAIYSDGGQFCFSCRKPTSSKVSPYALQHVSKGTQMEYGEKRVQLPSDATQHYSKGAVDWAAKYDITVEQLIQRGVVYSPQKDQLIFTWKDEDGKLLAYQARNLNAVSKAKRYYTSGDVNSLLPIYFCGVSLSDDNNHSRCVLVEDCLSAIKLASLNGLGCDKACEKPSGFDAMPLLGSGIGLSKLTRLRAFYDVLDVWLDSNMYHKAQDIVRQAQLIGFKARALYSESDPKCYNEQELLDKLGSGVHY